MKQQQQTASLLIKELRKECKEELQKRKRAENQTSDLLEE